jgi:hypothetical protein
LEEVRGCVLVCAFWQAELLVLTVRFVLNGMAEVCLDATIPGAIATQ